MLLRSGLVAAAMGCRAAALTDRAHLVPTCEDSISAWHATGSLGMGRALSRGRPPSSLVYMLGDTRVHVKPVNMTIK